MDEAEAMRGRIEALERERSEEIARANAALAAAQDRSYWLERWNVDLNALMRKRGAAELRGAIRALKAAYTLLRDAGGRLPPRLAKAQRRITQEREQGQKEVVAEGLEAAGLQQRAGDAWLEIGGTHDLPAALERIAELRARLEPGERLVLGMEPATRVTPAELLAEVTRDWRIVLYREGDPNLYVLERR